MNFTTHNTNPRIKTNGTCLQGQIKASYGDLKKKFGQPTNGDEYKTKAEWEIEFEDGTVATIYDWKDSTPLSKITDWHIGGDDQKAVRLVKEALGK